MTSEATLGAAASDWSKRNDVRDMSPIWEAFMRTCCPPAAKVDSEGTGEKWPEINEIAKLAQPTSDGIVNQQRTNNPHYDVTKHNNKRRAESRSPEQLKRETSFFVDQIIGRRDSTGSDKGAEMTSSDDASTTTGSDVSMTEQSGNNKAKFWVFNIRLHCSETPNSEADKP